MGEPLTCRLPDGTTVHCLNRTDAHLLYQEIFDEDIYRRHGVTVRPGDCVLDVGANIGLFPLFLRHLGTPATVHAVEPVPVTFEALRLNVAACFPVTVHLHNVGLARQDGEATFTHYPRLASNSTMHPDHSPEEVKRRRDDILQRMREHPNRPLRWFLAVLPGPLKRFIAERVRRWFYRHEAVVCRLTTLSGLLRRERIDRIDLLKLDAERCELDVLAGLDDADWPKVRQAVVEVHDPAAVPGIEEQFRARGFRVVVECNSEVLQTRLLYAVRDGTAG
jgi:FkbM family methyltransferase